MSVEQFDPEAVRRYSPFPDGTCPDGWPLWYVDADDYDALLALYHFAVLTLAAAEDVKCGCDLCAR